MSAVDLAGIERTLHLRFAKWDTQVGDVPVLSEQPVIVTTVQWQVLCEYAEALAAETILLESVALEEPGFLRWMGVPENLSCSLRSKAQQTVSGCVQPRAMRFDFHPTRSGWRVSEVNSDVPGGWREATSLPALYHPFYRDLHCPPSPLSAWGEAMQSVARGGRVALMHAPGYLEDEQVIRSFRQELAGRQIPCSLVQTPRALRWRANHECSLAGTGDRVTAIVRFYQAEWLSALPQKTGWMEIFNATSTTILNPICSVISESKRFPLAFETWRELCPTWRALMPECRDPRDVRSSCWDNWVLKGTYSNTGDQVALCAQLNTMELRRLVRKARRHPWQWIAQKRFQTLPLESSRGPVFPCIGVFVVNGKAAGAYARLSASQVTDGSAVEAPVLLRQDDSHES